jgi:diketogulonate reductase-like aldo/keto reductase
LISQSRGLGDVYKRQSLGITMMAYSPLSNGRNNILKNRDFIELAKKYNYKPAKLALAWTIRNPGVISIPRSFNHTHIEDNFETTTLQLDNEILSELTQLFPL